MPNARDKKLTNPNPTDLLPLPPWEGPPLPRAFGVTWDSLGVKDGHSQYSEPERPLRFVVSADETIQLKSETIAPVDITLVDWISRWLKRYTGRTFDGYESICRIHIIPALGNIRLRELTKARIQTFMDSIKRSQTTKSHIRATLHKILEDAIEEELLERNPCARVHAPLNYTSSKINPLSSDELGILLSAISIPFYPLITTAATTGLRLGEILALGWAEVDLKQGMLRVTRSLEKRHGVVTIKEVKNRQNRAVYLSQFTVRVLSQLHARSGSLVFCHEDSSPLDGDVVTHSFQRSLKELKLRQIRFHDLRHTHATQLLMAGVPLKVVQERLGHQSAKMTLDLYGHFVPGLQEKFITELDISGFPKETAELGASYGFVNRSSSVRIRPLADNLFIELLNQLTTLGEVARQLKQALGSNGHKLEKLEEIKEILERQT